MKAGMRCWWLVAGLAVATLCIGRAEQPPAGEGEGTRFPGKFVWADLVTDDLAAATGFYRELFGWTFREANGYWIAENGGYPVAGVFQRPRPADRAAKPRWFGNLSVDDVAQAVRAVEAGGGRVVAPRQTVPGRGEQAVFTDPEGALFGAVHMESGDPADYAADVGDWIWMQLWSGDGHAAAVKYRAGNGGDAATGGHSPLATPALI